MGPVNPVTDPARALHRQTVLVALCSAAALLVVLVAGTALALGQAPSPSAARTSGLGPGIGASAAGRPAYPFAATALNGHRLRLTDFRGRPLVVNFFASWCPPCAKEAPTLRAMSAHYGNTVAFVSLATGDTAAAARRFANKYRWSWPVVLDADFGLAHAFGVPGTPTTVVIDRRGRIAVVFYGPITVSRLTAVLNGLLTQPEGY